MRPLTLLFDFDLRVKAALNRAIFARSEADLAMLEIVGFGDSATSTTESVLGWVSSLVFVVVDFDVVDDLVFLTFGEGTVGSFTSVSVTSLLSIRRFFASRAGDSETFEARAFFDFLVEVGGGVPGVSVDAASFFARAFSLALSRLAFLKTLEASCIIRTR